MITNYPYTRLDYTFGIYLLDLFSIEFRSDIPECVLKVKLKSLMKSFMRMNEIIYGYVLFYMINYSWTCRPSH